jgi:hypothetical protein
MIGVPVQDFKIFKKLKIHTYNSDAYIAGGCALSWYRGLPLNNKDIDVWFKTDVAYEKFLSQIISYDDVSFLYNSDHAQTYSVNTVVNKKFKRYRIQLIKKIYPSIHDTLSKFDINLCKIGTDGINWYHDKSFEIDFETKLIKINDGIIKPNTLKRVLKYMSYGYTIADETIYSLINHYKDNYDSIRSNASTDLSEYEFLSI